MSVINFEDGQCKRVRSYLDSYLNNELLVETNHDVLTHLQECDACSRSLEDRARLKAQLKRAVMQEYAPAALRERIGNDLRRSRGFSLNTFSLAVAAVAAVLVIAVVTFTLYKSSTTSKPLSLQANVSTGDVTGQILKIGYDDHVFCAIDHNLANKQFTPEQINTALGPEYAGLVALVKQKMPKDFVVAVGHHCRYNGREFVHLIIRNGDDRVSLVITRKTGEAFPAGGAATVLQASGAPIYEASWHNIQVAGMETPEYLVFVISTESLDDNQQLASRLGPVVSEFLKKEA